MNDLGSAEKDAAAVDRLAKCDPVYERFQAPRACKLCGAQGRDRNAENVSHQPDCPWIYALKSRDAYGPGGKFDRTKTPEERAALAAPKTAPPRGDLAVAQQVLANLWVTMSEARGLLSASEMPRERVAEMLDGALRNLAKSYSQAQGDRPLDD